MNTRFLSLGCLGSLLFAGCAHDPNNIGLTDPNQPGPAVGRAIGTGVGAVGGQVVGGVVGVGEGAVGAVKAPFNNTRRVVRRWRTETTADGRTIRIPEDVVVDAYGRPVESKWKKYQTEQ